MVAVPPTSSSSEAAAAAAAEGGGAPAGVVADADAPHDLLDNNEGQRSRHCSQNNFDLLAKAAAALVD